MPRGKKAPGATPEKKTGRRTGASGTLTWCLDHRPVTDWICWNQSMRIFAPVLLVILILVPLLEYLSGGSAALSDLLSGGFLITLVSLFLFAAVLTGLVLFLQGPDVLDILVDSKGVHLDVCLPRPTTLRLLARFRSPDLPAGEDGMVLISHTDLAWAQIRRIQLWPDKNTVLLYRTLGFLTLAVPCTPFTYGPMTDMLRDKLGKKEGVRMPRTLRPPQTLEKLHQKDAKAHAAKEKKIEARKKRLSKASPSKPAAAASRRNTSKTKKAASSAKKQPTKRSPTAISPEFLADIQRMNAEDEENARRQDMREKS